MKIAVPNFQKYRAITYRFRKIESSHVLSHWVNLSFARNARGDVNIGTKILSPLACSFTKNEALSSLLFKGFVNL